MINCKLRSKPKDYGKEWVHDFQVLTDLAGKVHF